MANTSGLDLRRDITRSHYFALRQTYRKNTKGDQVREQLSILGSYTTAARAETELRKKGAITDHVAMSGIDGHHFRREDEEVVETIVLIQFAALFNCTVNQFLYREPLYKDTPSGQEPGRGPGSGIVG